MTPAGRKKRTEAQRHWRQAQAGLNALLGIERVALLNSVMDESLALLTKAQTTIEAT